ncbi:ArsR/SmtB family transcription factor [Sphingomonas morindae]|uniref:Helix-turn-helix domain-containing protein n=1 Tax=Sphingomonas morindae TaxID=1541170 RepID=A0ABY4XCX8_9SPHN|nr:helix-turn-helix domain-containing protein [Sphingomonas morindae]USI74768.1 helix-turn-helix domain-containing protein [Sphingomonas morindae]
MQHPAIETVGLDLLFQALSDPVRLAIVAQLAEGEASCAALNGDRPKSSMSHHFRVLRGAGLVHTRTAGTSHVNTLRRADLDRRFPGLLDAILAAYAAAPPAAAAA